MNKIMRLAGVGLVLGAGSLFADVKTASVFGDHMVLQRDMPVPIWGKAAPGESVSVTFGAQQAKTTADTKGDWKVSLPAMPANAQPAELVLVGATNRVVLKDVLVGEVWLCSGQSNMYLPLRSCMNPTQEMAACNYPDIRLFTTDYAEYKGPGLSIRPKDKVYALHPQANILGEWKVCLPKNAAGFSGVAYFFGRRLHSELKVPIGLLVTSMGATAIEAWTSLEGLKAIPRYRQRALAFEEICTAYEADTNSFPGSLEIQKKNLPARLKPWFEELDREEPGLASNWMSPDTPTADWARIALPVAVTNNPLGTPVASLWFRKEVTIPADWTGSNLDLHLGQLDAVDEAYVNGTRVGRTWFDASNYWERSRLYPVPAKALATNRVTVVLRLVKLIYPMGVFGPAGEMKLTPAGSTNSAVSLAGDWVMKKSQDLDPGRQPQLTPVKEMPGHHYGHPGVMYNGLLNPLIPYAIRGAIWYQGEANAPFYADYRYLLPGMITSWRKAWGQGDFPFGVVQLADYWEQQTRPVEPLGYTPLREAQTAALELPNTFLATAVGVGEGNNIHPKNKQEVGRRLALGALGVAYGQTNRVYMGITYKSMSVKGNAIRLRFDFATGLHARGEPLVGFSIAGEDRTFYFATARIEGDTVVVSSEKVPKPVAVRYAWATNPVCNLYNAEELPAFPFHTDGWDLSQLVVGQDTITLPSGWKPKR